MENYFHLARTSAALLGHQVSSLLFVSAEWLQLAPELASQHRHTHILQDLGMLRHIPGEQQELIGRGFNARGGTSFNNLIETVYEPKFVLEQLSTLEKSVRLTYACRGAQQIKCI